MSCKCPEKYDGDFCEIFVSGELSKNNLERFYGLTEEKSVIIALFFPVPSAPPGKVFVKATSSTRLLVSWSSVPQKHRHGEVLLHKIHISLANKQNDSFTVHVSNSTQSYVNYLQVYTLYVIRVSAVNGIGESPKSKPFTARTMASGRLISVVKTWRSITYLQQILLTDFPL